MKKVLVIIGVIVLLVIIDLFVIYKFNRPLFAIEKENNMYSGILYNTYNCKEFSIPVIKFKTVKYSCAKDDEKKIKDIVDKTIDMKDFACAEALENFYNDDKYSYYYSCIKSDYIVVIYDDGSEQRVSDALKEGNISIEDLDTYEIKYYRYDKYE